MRARKGTASDRTDHKRAERRQRPHGEGRAEPRPPNRPQGFAAREVAVAAIAGVLDGGHALDATFEAALHRREAQGLEPRDRALARLVASTVLRRRGELAAVIDTFIERPLPEMSGRLRPILLAATAQLLALGTPPHAVINIAVEQCRADRAARRFDKLTNAVLRRVATEGPAILTRLDGPTLNIPAWLRERWQAAYGDATAAKIAEASLREAALDLSVKSDAQVWAEKLGGFVLPTGSVRLVAEGRIDALPGFAEGAWWVQDAAAALPARLVGPAAGLEIADLCAAPGGKTANLAAAGARVTAVDISAERLGWLRDNLARLGLDAEIAVADILEWSADRRFDAILLDAPCTATGTIRRHPDILHLKRPSDIAALAALQERLIDRALDLLRPGGRLIYCTCSLEPEEGPGQVARLLDRDSRAVRIPIEAHEVGGTAELLTAEGDLRTLPFHLPNTDDRLSGMDGFYAARIGLKA